VALAGEDPTEIVVECGERRGGRQRDGVEVGVEGDSVDEGEQAGRLHVGIGRVGDLAALLAVADGLGDPGTDLGLGAVSYGAELRVVDRPGGESEGDPPLVAARLVQRKALRQAVQQDRVDPAAVLD
jgi:hypothetical protein